MARLSCDSRLLPQPDGFKGLGVVPVVLLPDYPAAVQRDDARPHSAEGTICSLTPPKGKLREQNPTIA